VRFDAAKGWVELRAVVVDVDEETGRARSIKRLTEV
jgi:calcineurin-like phosphoesterase